MLNNSKLIKLLDYWNNYWTPELDELLTPKGHFAEWVNPGVMMVCEC